PASAAPGLRNGRGGAQLSHIRPEVVALMFRTLAARAVDFLKKEEGPTAVEYAVMLALIIVVCMAAIQTLGQNAKSTFSNVSLNMAASGAAAEATRTQTQTRSNRRL